MEITYFRSRIPGPEQNLEDAVVKSINFLSSNSDFPYWIACSAPIGAGMPDILIAFYNSKVLTYPMLNASKIQLIAFLRQVNKASQSFLNTNFQHLDKSISNDLTELVEMNIIKKHDGIFSQWLLL